MEKETQTNEYVMTKPGGLTHLFNYVWREHSGGEGSPEDVRKLLVKATNAHPLKVPVWANNRLT